MTLYNQAGLRLTLEAEAVGADNTLIDPGAGKYVRIHSVTINRSTAGALQLHWGNKAAGEVFLALDLKSSEPATVEFPDPEVGSSGDILKITGLGSGTFSGVIEYSIWTA